MSDSAIVYWAHLPEHTNVLTQGYIGVTSKSLSHRQNQHIRSACNERDSHYNDTFKCAIRKYDNIVWDVLVISDYEYVLYVKKISYGLLRIQDGT